MVKIRDSLVSLLFVTLFFSCVLAQQKDQVRYLKVEKENLRATPKGEKIGEILQSTKLKVLEEKGNWLNVQITGWIWKPSTTPHKAGIGKLKAKKGNAVKFVNYKIRKLPADYTRDSKPYAAHVRAYFQFKNNSDKTLTGLVYEVTFLDSFGDVLYKTSCKDQLKLNPGNVNPMDAFWYWEDNEFMPNQPYDKLQAAAGAGTIKVQVTIQKAVFSDGSVIEFKR